VGGSVGDDGDHGDPESSFVAQWKSIALWVRTIPTTGLDQAVQDSEGEVVVVLRTSSVEFHGVNFEPSL
jgi:hypothetical protein